MSVHAHAGEPAGPAPRAASALLLDHDDALEATLRERGIAVVSDPAALPDLVFLDCDRLEPGVTAGAAAARARTRWPAATLLAVGAGTPPRAVVDALHAGAVDWIVRPVQPTEAASAIERALLRRDLGRQGRDVQSFLEQQSRQVEEDRRLLEARVAAMGDELATAHSELSTAHRELRARVAQLVMLYRIGRDLSRDRNWDQALARLLGNLRGFLVADGAGLLLASAGGRRLAPRSVDGLSATLVERAAQALGSRDSQPSGEGQPFPLEEWEGGRDTPCVVCPRAWRVTVLPLQRGEQTLGYLLLERLYSGSAAIAEDLHFLITIQTILAEEVAGAQALFELRALQRFQERTLDEVESGILTLGQDGQLLYANRKARSLLAGVPDAVGAARGVRVAGDGATLWDWLAGAGHMAVSAAEGWVVAPQPGERIPLGIRASRLRGEIPGHSYVVVVLEDQRSTRQLEAERRRAARQQELLVMAAEWAHDVRTPLTGILHSAELLADTADAEARGRHLPVIRGEVQRIDGLVSNFLDFARPVRLRRSPTDVQALAAAATALMQPRARERAVSLALLPGTGMPVVAEVDTDQLKQVLLNLIDNALDATPAGRAVAVTVVAAPPPDAAADWGPGAVCIEVVDDGAGVPSEHLERLFVPFFTTKAKGNGLGLAISEKIVRGHGGHLRYERRDGRTILRAWLPVAEPTGAEGWSLQARG